MSSKILILVTLLVSANVLAGFGIPNQPSPGETRLRQMEEDARIASEKADPKWYTDHLAESWVLVSHREHITLSKSEALALLAKASSASTSSTSSPIQVTKEEMKVYLVGKTGIVSYRQKLSGGDAQPPNSRVEYVTDVFSETPQGWVLVYTQEDSANPEVA